MCNENTIDERLKDFILSRFKSIREFTIYADIPYSTVSAILKRGIANSSVNNIIKICNALNISADELANNKIVPLDPVNQSSEPRAVEIVEILQSHKFNLECNDNYITLDGKPITASEAELLNDFMEITIEVIRKKRKKGVK